MITPARVDHDRVQEWTVPHPLHPPKGGTVPYPRRKWGEVRSLINLSQTSSYKDPTIGTVKNTRNPTTHILRVLWGLDSENSCLSGGLPISSSRRRRGEKGGGGESGETSGVRSKSTVESTTPIASSRSRAGEAMDETPKVSPRVSAKSP